MKEITQDELFKAIVPEAHGALSALLKRDDVEGAVLCESVQADSPIFGARCAVVFGPGCRTLKRLEDSTSFWLGDHPLMRQYPTAYFRKREGL